MWSHGIPFVRRDLFWSRNSLWNAELILKLYLRISFIKELELFIWNTLFPLCSMASGHVSNKMLKVYLILTCMLPQPSNLYKTRRALQKVSLNSGMESKPSFSFLRSFSLITRWVEKASCTRYAKNVRRCIITTIKWSYMHEPNIKQSSYFIFLFYISLPKPQSYWFFWRLESKKRKKRAETFLLIPQTSDRIILRNTMIVVFPS